MKKNDEFEIVITDMGSEGEGIGKYEGMTFFIKGAVIGDRILAGVTKLKKTFGYARLVKVMEPSPYRVEADCPVAKRCGGCQLRSLSYDKQLEFKENKVRNDLMRLGGIAGERFSKAGNCGTDVGGNLCRTGICDAGDGVNNCSECVNSTGSITKNSDNESILWNPIIGMETPVHYRNKGQFPVGTDSKGKIVTGFYAGHTHDIIDCESCLIQHPITDFLMSALKNFMQKENISAYDETSGKGLVRHVLTRVGFVTGEVMVCIVINGKKMPKADILTDYLKRAVEEYSSKAKEENAAGKKKAAEVKTDSKDLATYTLTSVTFSTNTENTNVILGDNVHLIYGTPYITDYIGDVKYRISPLSFYQVNPVQTGKLYSTALEYADIKGKTVWDLYCGIGTISLFMAKEARKVYGVEIVPAAINDARENAKLNNIENAEFFVGAAEEVLPAKYAENPEMTADVIVVDPPRKGCDENLLKCMVSLAPERIVYVSCDPATLSRDVKYLEENGYRVKKVQTVDMFPGSVHVETVCLLSKLHEAKHHVRVKMDMDEMDITSAESKATYEEIKKYVAEHNDGMKVSNLYIAQVKKKCGIETGENHNLPKSEDARQPQCPKEKEDAIMEALKAFQMI